MVNLAAKYGGGWLQEHSSSQFRRLELNKGDVEAVLREHVNSYPGAEFGKHTGLRLDSRILERACRKLGVKAVRFGSSQLLIEGEEVSGMFHGNMFSTTPYVDRCLTHDKPFTKLFLRLGGVPVPRGRFFACNDKGFDDALRFMHMTGRVAVKPFRGSLGRGVTAGVGTEEDFRRAWQEALERTSKRIIVEEFVPGDDIRIMVVGGRACGAILRKPAHVIGDGRSTIKQLVDSKNRLRKKNPYYASRLIPQDESTSFQLQKQEYTWETVPPAGQEVRLQAKANLSAGGDGFDITDYVHSDILELCERAMAVFPQAGHGGVDVIAEDFTRPLADQRAAILELNLNNEIAMHLFPLHGKSRDLAVPIVEHYCTGGGHAAKMHDLSDRRCAVDLILPRPGGRDDPETECFAELAALAAQEHVQCRRIAADDARIGASLTGKRRDVTRFLFLLRLHELFGPTISAAEILHRDPDAAARPAAAE